MLSNWSRDGLVNCCVQYVAVCYVTLTSYAREKNFVFANVVDTVYLCELCYY